MSYYHPFASPGTFFTALQCAYVSPSYLASDVRFGIAYKHFIEECNRKRVTGVITEKKFVAAISYHMMHVDARLLGDPCGAIFCPPAHCPSCDASLTDGVKAFKGIMFKRPLVLSELTQTYCLNFYADCKTCNKRATATALWEIRSSSGRTQGSGDRWYFTPSKQKFFEYSSKLVMHTDFFKAYNIRRERCAQSFQVRAALEL